MSLVDKSESLLSSAVNLFKQFGPRSGRTHVFLLCIESLPESAIPYGKAVSLRISGKYAANNWRTALFAVIVRNIFTSCREYPANKTGQSKK